MVFRGAASREETNRLASARGTAARKLGELSAALEGKRRLLILTHDNPDPDSIASGWALMRVVHRLRPMRIDLGYGGIIGRGENRAMREVLKVPLQEIDRLDPASYDAIALVDCQPFTGNNSLPAGHIPTAVIDHHPLRAQSAKAPFLDIRPGYGSTAAMLNEYLQAAGVSVDRRLATALFYAVKAETRNLGREASPADVRTFLGCFPLVDNKALSRIEHPPIPRSYFLMFDQALGGTCLHGALAITRLGEVSSPDVVAEFADVMVRLETVRWALVMGHFGNDMILSFRTDDPAVNAGRTIQRVIGVQGKAGGHGMMAGGKVEGGARRRDESDRLEGLFEERARALLNAPATGTRLIERPRARGKSAAQSDGCGPRHRKRTARSTRAGSRPA
jgi:nanoRNase/pAp phosphatase (c-di-AMP/oligoRNAs hydrolase)